MHLKLTVGEMARITGVPARTIRYYNQIGLFNPSGVRENGYRYFSVEKIEELRMINYLRHTGLSIEEVRGLFNNPKIDEYRQQLQDELPEGDWLTVYVRGDHSDAAPWYRRMLAFAAKRQLKPAGYGIERTLSDSTLSSDPQLHITEVQIPLNKAG